MRTPDDDDLEMDDRVVGQRHGGADTYGGLADLMMSASDLRDPELDRVLLDIRDLGRTGAPQPSPELQSLLTKGLPNLRQRRRRARRRRVVVGTVLAGSMTMSLTGIAAANDRLPGASQGVIAGVINDLTPFHIEDRRPDPGIPRVPEQRVTTHPTGPHPSSEPTDDRGSQSPEPSGTQPGPAPAPTPTRREHETEPGSSSTAPREPSESEGVYGEHRTGSSSPVPSSSERDR